MHASCADAFKRPRKKRKKFYEERKSQDAFKWGVTFRRGGNRKSMNILQYCRFQEKRKGGKGKKKHSFWKKGQPSQRDVHDKGESTLIFDRKGPKKEISLLK